MLGFLLAPADFVGGLPEPHPFFNVINTNLFCPREELLIDGELADGSLGRVSREGPPPSCVDPIFPTQADRRDRADLLVDVSTVSSLGTVPEEVLYLFPRNISGNPEAELTVQACCILGGAPPDGPPSTSLDPGPEEIDETLRELARDFSMDDAGIPPPPTVYEDTGMPVEETANAKTEVKQDKA